MAVVHNYSIDHNENGGNPVCLKQCSSRSLRRQTFKVCIDGDQPGGKCQTKWARVCVCRRTCAISGRGSVIFGDWRRGAVTACGLSTEGPLFFLESGVGGRGWMAGRRGWFAVDGPLPRCQFMTYSWVKLNVGVSQYQIYHLPISLVSTPLFSPIDCFFVNPWRRNFPFVWLMPFSVLLKPLPQLNICAFLQRGYFDMSQ